MEILGNEMKIVRIFSSHDPYVYGKSAPVEWNNPKKIIPGLGHLTSCGYDTETAWWFQPIPLKNMKVKWEYIIPNMWNIIQMFQTINQNYVQSCQASLDFLGRYE